jgi:hypothetical protein
MKEQVELRIKQTQLSTTQTLADLMVADVVANQNFFETGVPNIYDAYPIGSKVEIINLSLVVLFTGYVSGVDAVNNLVYFNQLFPLDILAADVSAVSVYANIGTEESVDLYENESISQNWQFTDLNSFQPLGTFTREFRVPYTAQNAEILGLFYDVNFFDVGNVFDTKLSAKILVDKLVISTGVLRIINVVLNKNGWHDLQVAFYGQTPQLFIDIKDRKFRQINGLANLNHIVNAYSILSFNILLEQRCYALIERGQRLLENNAGAVGVEYNNTVSGDDKLVSALTLCVSWDYIFEAIVVGAGYELDAPILLNTLKDYWCPWIGKSSKPIDATEYLYRQILNTTVPNSANFWGMTSQVYYDATNLVTVPPSVVSPTFLTLLDNSGSLGDGVYTCPITGDYKIAVWATYILYAPFDQMNAFIRWTKIATGAVQYVQVFQDTMSSGSSVPRNVYGFTAFNGGYIPAEQGDTFEVVYMYNDGGVGISSYDLRSNTGASTFYTFGSGWECVDVRPRQLEYYRDMTIDAPDILQTDFVNDVLKMHNCVVIPDNLNPRKIKIEPIVSFLGSGTSEDWSTKLDTSKDIIIKSAAEYQKKKLEFTYSAGQDRYSKIFTTAGRTYGNYEIDGYPIDNIGSVSQFIDGELNIKLVTQSTPTMLLGSWVATSGFTSVPAPHFVDDNWNYVPPALRCLFIAGLQDITMVDTAFNIVPAQSPLMSHYNSLTPSITDYDLNWSPETPLVSVPSQPYNNLFNLYWRSYLDQIYSGRVRIMEAHFALTLNDILVFGFDKYYWIKDAYWRVLEIRDYKYGKQESTSVVLIKIVNEASQCNIVPVSSDGGVVQWENLEGDSVEGTAICCNLYGWTWNPAQQICFANISNEPLNDGEARSLLAGGSLNSTGSSVPIFSIAAGRDITIENGAQHNLLLHGDALTVKGNLSYSQIMGKQNEVDVSQFTRGIHLSGVNGKTLVTGSHYAGGIRDNTTVSGAMQTGEVLLYNKTVFISTGSQQNIFLDNQTPLIFPEDTTWFIQLESIASDSNGFFILSEYRGVLVNKAGVLTVNYLDPAFLYDSIGSQFNLEPKITVGTGEFLVKLKCNDIGGTPYIFPTPPVSLTCRIKYIQTR